MNPRPCPPTVSAVEVHLDRPRWLVEDFAALAAFEDLSGVNSRDATAMGDLNATNYAAYVWALLRRDDPSIGIVDVHVLLSQPAHIVRLEQALSALTTEAVRLATEALGDNDGDGGGGENPLSSGAGGDSPPTPASTSD
jgi:hypothetical protein